MWDFGMGCAFQSVAWGHVICVRLLIRIGRTCSPRLSCCVVAPASDGACAKACLAFLVGTSQFWLQGSVGFFKPHIRVWLRACSRACFDSLLLKQVIMCGCRGWSHSRLSCLFYKADNHVFVQGMGGGDAAEVIGAKEPRKSWQMRKRQERAALKEGLAEWQVRGARVQTMGVY